MQDLTADLWFPDGCRYEIPFLEVRWSCTFARRWMRDHAVEVAPLIGEIVVVQHGTGDVWPFLVCYYPTPRVRPFLKDEHANALAEAARREVWRHLYDKNHYRGEDESVIVLELR